MNATGTVKLPPLFIHKHQTPRDMLGIDKSKLPVDYYWNAKAWMQVSIWNRYLEKLNERMVKENKNILLLFDNAPVHILDEKTHINSFKVKYISDKFFFTFKYLF